MTGKAAKKTRLHKATRAETSSYRVLLSKIEPALAKKLENKESTKHNIVVLQVMKEFAPDYKTLAEIVDGAKKTGRYKTKRKDIRGLVLGDIRGAEEKGIVAVKASEAEAAAAATA